MAAYDAITRAAIALIARRDSNTRELANAIEAKHPGAIARAEAARKRKQIEHKFSGNPPAWARRMVLKHSPGLDQLRWHRSQNGTLHGTCSGFDVSLTVPASMTPEKEALAKALLLHELAHARAPYAKHGDRFYDAWYRLLVAERLYKLAVGKRDWHYRHGLRRAASRARAA